MSFPLGSVVDSNIDYLLKRQFIPPFAFIKAATESSAGAGGGPATLTAGWSTNAAQFLNINGAEVGALRFTAVSSTISTIWRPYDMDNRWPVYVRYAWSSNAAAACVATFNSRFSLFADGVAPATPSTALSTNVVATAKSTTADTWTWTRWGNISPLSTGQFAFQTFPATVDAVAFSIAPSSLTNGAIATDFLWFYGMEIAYTPRLTFGDGSGREARYMNQVLSTGPQEAGPTFSIKT